MFRRTRGRRLPAAAVAMVVATAAPVTANPVAGVRVTNASTRFDLSYAASASSLGGYVTSDNAPLATIPHQTSDAYTVTAASAKALAGELIYRTVADPTRECTFRYTLTFNGAKFVLSTDARPSWTGAVACAATTSAFDKAKGDFSVSFTMQ